MRIVIQRVSKASVAVDEEVVGQIGRGFMVLVGVEEADSQEDVDYLVRKTANMRIFEDEEGKMNISLKDIGGQILSISQFTLHANTKKGNRPSFVDAARPDHSLPLYEAYNEGLRQEGLTVETGEFGADMQISLINDGPVTIIIDSKDR